MKVQARITISSGVAIATRLTRHSFPYYDERDFKEYLNRDGEWVRLEQGERIADDGLFEVSDLPSYPSIDPTLSMPTSEERRALASQAILLLEGYSGVADQQAITQAVGLLSKAL
jgi:hypothetical protein